MPVYSVRSSDARNTRRLAILIAVNRRLAANDRVGAKPNGQVMSSPDALFFRKDRIVSSASCDATSPALWPPIPSATATTPRSGSSSDESSLIVRTVPGCVREHTVSIETAPFGNARRPVMIPPPSAAAQIPPMFVLIVTQRGITQEFLLAEGRTMLGRGQNCDVVINDESISRQHARLLVGDDQVELTDLQSRNGTYVAGRPVRDATLRGGEQLSFGDVTAPIERRAHAPAGAQ